MNFKDKRFLAAGGLSIALLMGSGFAIANYQANNNKSDINYIDGVETVADANTEGGTAAEQTKKLNDEEGIDAEQIVVKITDEGYVTSHGDHFHYYSGKVPYDALISEELVMNDSNYKLKQSDIVSEHKDGFIIKVNGQYYLYLKNPEVRDSVRTKEEILEQRAQVSGGKAGKAGKGGKGGASGSIFSGSGHRNAQGRYTTDDGYVFTPGSIVQDTGDAYIVSHGDHFHYVPKADLSASERAAAEAYLHGGSGSGKVASAGAVHTSHGGGSSHGPVTVTASDGTKVTLGGSSSSSNSSNHGGGYRGGSSSSQSSGSASHTNTGSHGATSSNKDHSSASNSGSANKGNGGSTTSSAKLSDLENKMNAWYKMPKNKRHTEKDGLVFDPRKVTEENSFGYVIPHGDHFHIIPFNQLTAEEIQAANAALNAKAKGQKIPSESEINKKLNNANKRNSSKPSTNKPAQKPDKGEQKPSKDESANKVTHTFMGKKIEAYGKGTDGKPYTTSDGYTFNKESIMEVDDKGVIASHEDHIHYFGLGELEQNELDQVAEWVKENNKNVDVNDQSDSSKPAFNAEKVVDKKDGSYIVRENGKDYKYAEKDLDDTQRAFAEMQIAQNKDGKYVYQVAPAKVGELEPELLVNMDDLPMHAANATIDTGDAFIIPHIDHIHIAFYKDMSKEQIATVKYIMQHPEVRPEPWTTEGHDDKKPSNDDVKYIVGVTPKDKRAGMKNWQIVHDIDEVKQARAEGRYARNDGYIFDPEDIRDPKTKIYSDSYTIPTADGKRHDIPFTQLSDAELAAAKKVAAEVQAEKDKNKEQDKDKENNSNDSNKKDDGFSVDFPAYDANKASESNDDADTDDKAEEQQSAEDNSDAEAAPAAEQPVEDAEPEVPVEPTNDELKAAIAAKYGVSTSAVKLVNGQWEVTINGEITKVTMAEAKQLI